VLGATWQRCSVHFTRNAMANPKRKSGLLKCMLCSKTPGGIFGSQASFPCNPDSEPACSAFPAALVALRRRQQLSEESQYPPEEAHLCGRWIEFSDPNVHIHGCVPLLLPCQHAAGDARRRLCPRSQVFAGQATRRASQVNVQRERNARTTHDMADPGIGVARLSWAALNRISRRRLYEGYRTGTLGEGTRPVTPPRMLWEIDGSIPRTDHR
jgi:hypothetical protein